jgi:hypothetical protein
MTSKAIRFMTMIHARQRYGIFYYPFNKRLKIVWVYSVSGYGGCQNKDFDNVAFGGFVDKILGWKIIKNCQNDRRNYLIINILQNAARGRPSKFQKPVFLFLFFLFFVKFQFFNELNFNIIRLKSLFLY